MTEDVKQTIPPNGVEPLKKMPPVPPATQVSGFGGTGPNSVNGPGGTGFKLPEKVTTDEMKDMGRRYGNTW